MKLTMKTLAAGPEGVFQNGMEYDVSKSFAKQLESFWNNGPVASAGKKPAVARSETKDREDRETA